MAFKNYSYSGSDDQRAPVLINDLSGGVNTRIVANSIGQNQAQSLKNVDITVPGKRRKIKGSVNFGGAIEALKTVTALQDFSIQGGTDQLLAFCNNKVYKSESEGTFSEVVGAGYFTSTPGFTFGKESGLSPDDIMIAGDGTNNCIRVDSAGNIQDLGDTNTSPPLTDVFTWYGNRFWGLKNGLLYFSDAYSADYSGAFDRTSNSYRIPVGTERALVATRDLGIVVFGENAVWALAPSATPAATDQPQPLLTNLGAVSKNAVAIVGDDIFFFSQDGLRTLKRTVQDKLQMGTSFPVSYFLKTEFEEIDWDYIDRVCMKYFDNKLFISVPTSATTMKTWIYVPATDAFFMMEDVYPRCWATYKISGEERIAYGSHGDGKVHRAWYGYSWEGTTTTNGTAIEMEEISRAENVGSPLAMKEGGTIEVRASATGDYDLSVYAQFDNAGWNLLGAVNLKGNLVDLSGPVTFPVSFYEQNIASEKFSIYDYGQWRECELKITQETANGDDEIEILQTSIVTTIAPYID